MQVNQKSIENFTGCFKLKALRAFCLTLLFLFPFYLQGQPQTRKVYSTNKAAIRDYEDGRKQFDSGQDVKAIRLLESAIKKDSNFIDAWLILAQIYLESHDYKSALQHYRKAVSIDPAYMPASNMIAGELELKFGNYRTAKTDFEKYLQINSTLKQELKDEVLIKIKSCDFAVEALNNPVPFNPVNLGTAINTIEAEYFPSFTVDQKEIIFTRDIKDVGAPEGHQEDFYIATLKDSIWSTARNAGAPLNSALNEGGPSISADGRVLFFTACDRPDGQGSCDIYLSQRLSDGSWSKPINIGPPVNTAQWESQPSFSSDGKTLYFVRGSYTHDRSRVFDIYTSTFQLDMTWSHPKALSDTINTTGVEESVFIHPDNQTLYFSSDGHPGMGGLDIFISRKSEDGTWGTPVNLGYPINTHADENSLVVSADGLRAYFASNRAGGVGNLDLYSFNLYSSARPSLVSYVKAKVSDAGSGEPLAAGFEIIDVESGKIIVANTTDKRKGEFLACLPAGKNYMLNVNKEGYLFYSDYFECKEANTRQNAYDLIIKLHPPKPGEKVVLKNIFFDINRYELKPSSFPELRKLLAFLTAHPQLNIEVSGHTDSSGDKKSNQILSENRAKSVMEYLISKGIPSSRIAYKGYGDSRPVASNDTEEGRAKNRRTEFSIL